MLLLESDLQWLKAAINFKYPQSSKEKKKRERRNRLKPKRLLSISVLHPDGNRRRTRFINISHLMVNFQSLKSIYCSWYTTSVRFSILLMIMTLVTGSGRPVYVRTTLIFQIVYHHHNSWLPLRWLSWDWLGMHALKKFQIVPNKL